MKLILFALSVAAATGGPVSFDYKPGDVDVKQLSDSKTPFRGDTKWLNMKKELKDKAASQVNVPRAVQSESVVQFTVPVYWPVTPELTPPVVALPEVVQPNPGVPADTLPGGILPRPVIPEKLGVPASQVNNELLNDDSGVMYERSKGTIYATLKSWVDDLLDFVNSGVQYTHKFL